MAKFSELLTEYLELRDLDQLSEEERCVSLYTRGQERDRQQELLDLMDEMIEHASRAPAS